jgi:hypothetical protein
MVEQLFLILGTQRSGTTLLTKVLSSHHSAYVHNETWLPGLFRSVSPDGSNLEGIFREFLRKQAEKHQPQKALTHLSLKDPLLTDHLDQVERALQFAKAIIIVRDPRGVVRSYMENAWGLGTNVYTGSLRWRREVQQQLNLHVAYPDRTYLIRYEDLVRDLPATLSATCEFLGIEYDEEMLSYDSPGNGVALNRENRNVFKPLSSSVADRWESELSDRQKAIIESVCSEIMRELHYPLLGRTVNPGMVERQWYRLHQAVLGEIQLQYRMRLARRARKRRRSQAAKAAGFV